MEKLKINKHEHKSEEKVEKDLEFGVLLYSLSMKKKNKMLLESLNTEVFNFEHMP